MQGGASLDLATATPQSNRNLFEQTYDSIKTATEQPAIKDKAYQTSVAFTKQKFSIHVYSCHTGYKKVQIILFVS
jgi:hypothetical protein